MKLSDLNTSRFLQKNDVDEPIVVTVTSITRENVAPDGEQREEKGVLRFREFGDRGLVLNATNRDLVAEILGRKPDLWVGGKLELFIDPTVEFNRKKIGGIRVRAPSVKSGAKSATATFVDLDEDDDEDARAAAANAAMEQ